MSYKLLPAEFSDVIHITRGLVETLLRQAEEAEPDSRTVPLAVTRAKNLPAAGLSPDTPVFTHFYLSSKGDAINAIFGVDMKTPAAQTPGIFVSHPLGELKVTKEDDMREVIFLAVPPWSTDSFKAFDRSGNVRELEILDIEPPEETQFAEQ
ncbi:hypothetical protein SAMN05216226_10639 [Halovenus aranensis]|uniref:Proteasome lid subunit RPN8/RPN11, contains Jab1/MPN metalloenzyme (JAMM) motif n=1 Tax=Halovenus aranensis TaxID=890420 RepID=A0A1G8V7E1_9EURY|nr:hypothetical protein SAMN05216226_10639 [Halovenus aranensis]